MSKLTKSARGRDCQVRIIGICNGDNETTVLAHLGGGGMGAKSIDLHGAYSCSSCHDAIDGRVSTPYAHDELRLDHLEGVIRTQMIMFAEGLIK